MVKPEVMTTVSRLRNELVMHGISVRVDDSGVTIGKKYARVDELGIPFAITCDFVNDGKVTLRERDSASQVRISIDEVVQLVSQLCRSVSPRIWSEVQAMYPMQQQLQ
uniref:Glycine--tRNA ligase 1, mitochondrial n=1 Tax=Lygus hesperus TaxID=30085 RepID=A0A0A9WB34_LYGHE